MGRDRLLWKRTAAVSAGGTPTIATLVTTAVAVVLIVSGTFQRLVAITAFSSRRTTPRVAEALVVLRRSEPAHVRPFLAWEYPWSAGVVLTGAVALLVGTLAADTVNGAGALALLAAGLIGRAAFTHRVVTRSSGMPR